jgi:hypothetical protein
MCLPATSISGKALAPGGANEVRRHHLEHRGAGEANESTHGAHGQGEGRQHVRGRPVDPERREPAEVDGEDDDEDEGEPELGVTWPARPRPASEEVAGRLAFMPPRIPERDAHDDRDPHRECGEGERERNSLDDEVERMGLEAE